MQQSTLCLITRSQPCQEQPALRTLGHEMTREHLLSFGVKYFQIGFVHCLGPWRVHLANPYYLLQCASIRVTLSQKLQPLHRSMVMVLYFCTRQEHIHIVKEEGGTDFIFIPFLPRATIKSTALRLSFLAHSFTSSRTQCCVSIPMTSLMVRDFEHGLYKLKKLACIYYNR